MVIPDEWKLKKKNNREMLNAFSSVKSHFNSGPSPIILAVIVPMLNFLFTLNTYFVFLNTKIILNIGIISLPC